MNFQGIPEWYVTTKLPMLSKSGEVMGVMGIIQEYHGLESRKEPFLDINPAVDYLKNHFRENVSVKKLAQLSDLSVRQFERKFKAAFNTMPHQFLIKLRVHMACDMLRNHRLSVAEIAVDLGFYDQSAFAQHFKKYMGYTPLQYRKKYL
jgi:transcriptional regulator GlxA family with amidase domain